MGQIAVIGARTLVGGWALSGALVRPAENAEDVRTAWHTLPRTVAVVILTEAAAGAIGDERFGPDAPLTVVTPP